jgi:peptidoglycan/xylan/chitin deacetylase (PgdA/CDA1 family)
VDGGGGVAEAGPPSSASFAVDGVATWRGDATGAYSIIHDDVCDSSALGVFSQGDPELYARGLHAGFGVIVSRCDAAKSGTWAQVKTLIAHGHDVFGHSWDHPCMTKDKGLAASCDPSAPLSVDFAKEIGQAGTLLKTKTGVSLDFFIFPYDVCDPTAITYLKGQGYLGARCGQLGTNAGDFADPFAVDYDVFGPSYSEYFGTTLCKNTAQGAAAVQYTTTPAEYTDACRLYVLNHFIDDAIGKGGWSVRELHGFDPVDNNSGGWETVTPADYKAHLDYALGKTKTYALWMEGPTTVLRYRFARDPQNCALPTVSGGNTLHFAPPSAACAKYATALSYRIHTTDGSDPAGLQVQQGGTVVPVRRVSAGHFVADADPTKGDAVLVQ